MSIERALSQLEFRRHRPNITSWSRIEAQTGDYEDLPGELTLALQAALASQRISRLYSHQAEAYRLARSGANFVVVTPTASGKTLCYNLPVLDVLARDHEARAFYLFPTKALAQDQLAALQEWIRAAGLDIGVYTYDGDTPSDMRRTIRDHARVVLTNPDMLHTAILPHHTKWVRALRNLRFVVADELHTYRGVFGSHVCNVFRRLKRIARFYRSKPQFICASATIANPAELATRLLEEAVECITRNGAPRASKDLIFYNPPLVNPELGLRRGAMSVSRLIMELFLRDGVQTLGFATSRVNVEVLLRYLQRALQRDPQETVKVRGYRGGYLPKTRREIERQLRRGEILGVVSTNALELGIDIGSLEACVLAGYPGSIASTWQQIGRAGRRAGRSAAVLVARNLPLDQFIIRHPEYFLGRSPEHGLINPDNLQILVSHIKCAAFELPFEADECFGGEVLGEILDFLAAQAVLCKSGRSWHWSSEAYPADSVSLRNIPAENFVVFDSDEGSRAIAEVDFDSAPELIHPGAIYMCECRQYHVDKLDYEGRKAYVRGVKVDYYTEAVTYAGLRVLRSDGAADYGPCRVEHGEVHLAKKFPGFKKIKFYSNENLGYGEIQLPVHELHTTAYWFTVPEGALESTGLSRDQIVLAFLGLSYAMHALASLLLMCDLNDLGRSVGDRTARWFARAGRDGLGFYSASGDSENPTARIVDTFDPTIFLHDNVPGGVGFSEMIFNHHAGLLQQTLELIRSCRCKVGCPSCVGPADELGGLAKAAGRRILELLTAVGA
jgi:DEAD/DEAH box helicase domain-containing protein